MSKRVIGIILAVISAVGFGIGATLSNALFKQIEVSPYWLVTARMLFGGVLLLGYLLIRHQGIFSIWHDKKAVLTLILFGVFGVLFAQATFLLSVYYGNSAVSTILLSLGPALIVLLLAISSKTAPRRNEVLAIILALLGVFLVVTNGNVRQLNVPLKAFLWGLAAVAGVVAYTLIPRGLLAQHSALVVVGWGLFIGGVAANCFAPFWHVPAGFELKHWLLVAGIVVIGTVISYATYVAALGILPPAIVSMLGVFEPLTATVLAVCFLNVSFHGIQFLGVVLALIAIVLINVTLPAIKKNRL